MKKNPKNLVSLIVFAAIFCIGYAAVSFSAPSHNIKFTRHNLGTTRSFAGFKSTNETEICIFCHTPHNAVAGRKFLWTKTNTVNTFQMYTASPTLNFSKINGATLSDVSKMCMTCHDGAGALNAMANPRGAMMEGLEQIGDTYYPGSPYPCIDGREDWCVNIGEALLVNPDVGVQAPEAGTGGNMVNDHPVSFIYAQSTGDSTINPADGGGTRVGTLPLWWSDGGYRVECVTCHDPHINYVDGTPGGNSAYEPFLRKTMASSSLCFTCHNK